MPIQFTRAFRKLFFSDYLSSSTGNSSDDFDTLLAQCRKSSKKSDVSTVAIPSSQPLNLEIDTTDYRENAIQENLLKGSPIAYVAEMF